MKTALQRDLSVALGEIVGRPCWGFVAGKGTGSNFTMDFGRKLKRARPLTNPHLSGSSRLDQPLSPAGSMLGRTGAAFR
jgi:hypothetical protein